MSPNTRQLLVVNQDISASRIARLLRSARSDDTTILSSHHFFPSERTLLQSEASNLRILEFADVLSDEDNAACDEAAEATSSDSAPLALYARMVMHKNRMAHLRLGTFDRIHYADGLGISGDYWKSTGATRIERTIGRRAQMFLYGLREAWKRPHRLDYLISHGRSAVLFHGPIARLAFEPGADIRILSVSPRNALRDATAMIGNAPLQRATTMHFSGHARASDPAVLVCSDGYHPVNFPRSYLSCLKGRTLMPRDMFDDTWFGSHGFQTQPPFEFLRRESMQPLIAGKPLRRVVLALNHAGDWTAQVSRADTDRLIEAFAECAARHPGLRFRIRPHPTMTHPRHEGIASIKRIAEFLNGLDVPVELSQIPLEQDLSEGDLFVSEYSNVLLEAWKRGKLGIIANLTGRRDFMSSYSALGFAYVETADALSQAIAAATSTPEFSLRQQEAMDRYNTALDAFHERCNNRSA